MLDVKHLRAVLLELERQGWRCESTGAHHHGHRCFPPNGARPVTLHVSDAPRAWRNMRSQLRRAGARIA